MRWTEARVRRGTAGGLACLALAWGGPAGAQDGHSDAPAGAAADSAAWTPGTTVVLVRHAEKAAEPADDPGLTPAGRERAEALSRALADFGVTDVYATPYRRTRETAEPLADHLGLPVEVSAIPGGDVAAHVRALAGRIRSGRAGESVLVVGHSNTVPAIAEALTGEAVPVLGEEDYDRMFVVVVGPDGPRLLRTRYGPADASGHPPGF